MQQWYKPDLVQRFYLYHALNSGLQLEQLPKERFIIDRLTRKLKKVRDYRALEPVLTLIWLVDDTLRFNENYVAYTMTPELVLEFIKNERLWHNPEIRDLLTERERVLKSSDESHQGLGFLGPKPPDLPIAEKYCPAPKGTALRTLVSVRRKKS